MSEGANWPMTIFILLVVVCGASWFVWTIVSGIRAGEAQARSTGTGTPQPTPDPAAELIEADDEEPAAKVEQLSLASRARVDLRALPTVRMVIRGTGNWIGYGTRNTVRFDSSEYALLREPTNIHDANAIAIHHPNGRKVGYVSRTRAEGMAPQLDQIGPAAFVVAGGLDDGRLRVELPSLPALRTFVKRRSPA